MADLGISGSGIQKLTQQVGTQGVGAGGPGGIETQPANASDITRFQEAMKLGGEGFQAQPTSAASLQGPSTGPASWSQPSGGGGIGDTILRGLEGVADRRKALMTQIQDISSSTGTGQTGMQKMMEMQMKITQMTVEQEIVGKIAGQVSTAAQTLFRNQ